MATSSTKIPVTVPRWLRHRSLISSEALLLVGVLRELLSHQIHAAPLPNWAKVLFVMTMTVGLFGGLFVLIQNLTAKTVGKTHDVVQAIPLPMPSVLIHVAAFVGLFFLYAKVLGLPVIFR